ncbi:MAG: HEPN domain-containing protein [Bacteroidetes bacterium]|nr:HEPN domain-containing protein [Bacteroidota bacterium]
MSEFESLIKRAEKYLLSAKLLLREGDYESTASRIYYAMFFSSQAALLSKGLTYSSHKMVISAFGENFIKTNILPKKREENLIEHSIKDRSVIIILLL